VLARYILETILSSHVRNIYGRLARNVCVVVGSCENTATSESAKTKLASFQIVLKYMLLT
jgi:hypothetical protein